MCGILLLKNDNEKIVSNVLSRLKRGYDSIGKSKIKNSYYLGHTRLSIIDVSDSGLQPMTSSCGRYIISYNGELYNNNKIRESLEELDGRFRWKGTSDTETILESIRINGLQSTLGALNGMFALILIDKKTDKIYVARDFVGEKPLYITNLFGGLLICSDYPAIARELQQKVTVSKFGKQLYFTYRGIPSPYSIYKDVYKVLPGTCLEFNLFENFTEVINIINIKNAVKIVYKGENFHFKNAEQAHNKFDILIKDVVSDQLIADVPIGVFLSGGIDSSLITSIAAKLTNNKIVAYNIDIKKDKYSETKYAKAICDYLGIKMVSYNIENVNILEEVYNLKNIYNEPLADSSCIPISLLTRSTSKDIKVVLSGDGGDEVFYGYDKYRLSNRLWNILRYIPDCIKVVIAKQLRAIPRISNLLNINYRHLEIIIRLFGAKSIIEVHNVLMSNLNSFNEGFTAIRLLKKIHLNLDVIGKSNYELLCRRDCMLFMEACVLPKVDRASMANSLEVRSPLLDPRVINFSNKLPNKYKYDNRILKKFLKNILSKYLPDHLYNRPKQGFSVPIQDYIIDHLQDWTNSLMRNELYDAFSYREQNYYKWMYKINAKKKANYGSELWTLFVYLDWYRNNKHILN